MLFPNKISVILLSREDRRTYITDRLDAMCERLKSKYKIAITETERYLGVKFKQAAVIEQNGRFKIIDWNDRDNPAKLSYMSLLDLNNCQFVLKCQYNTKWNVPKFRPFFYFEKTKPQLLSESLQELRQIPKTQSKIFWKGKLHCGREEIVTSIRNLLNDDYEEHVPLEEFYKRMAQHRLALSLPGLGRSCHREFECFAIGTVVLSPLFENTYYAPLIPDYHYICVDPKSIPRKLKNITSNQIDFIRENAMRYYDTYIRFEASTHWFEKLLEL